MVLCPDCFDFNGSCNRAVYLVVLWERTDRDRFENKFDRVSWRVQYCSINLFLWKCIFLSRGLRMYADQLLLEKYEKLEETSIILKTTAAHFRELLKLDHEKTANLEEWLQIEEEQTESAGRISREKFINRFCQWEKLLKLLVEQESVDSMPSGQTLVQRMEIILQKQQNIPDQETEQRDAEENLWNAESWQALKKCEESLSLESRDKESKVFLDTFSLLASCRDLLMVLQDTEEADRQNLGKYRQELLKGVQIPRLFTFMLLYSSVRLFRTIPGFRCLFRRKISGTRIFTMSALRIPRFGPPVFSTVFLPEASCLIRTSVWQNLTPVSFTT